MTVHDSVPVRQEVDAKALRQAFGSFATGVTVVTTGGPIPHAMTANSFTSVSLDPALLLVCVDRAAVMHGCLAESGLFGVSVLAAHQEAEARHFANRHRTLGAAQFDNVPWTPGPLTGTPLIDNAIARFECELWRSYDGGDHTVFIGRVLSVDHEADGDALVVYKSRFRQIMPDWSEVTA